VVAAQGSALSDFSQTLTAPRNRKWSISFNADTEPRPKEAVDPSGAPKSSSRAIHHIRLPQRRLEPPQQQMIDRLDSLHKGVILIAHWASWHVNIDRSLWSRLRVGTL
jgi:hypothetical protein